MYAFAGELFLRYRETRGLDDCAKNADKTISLRTQKESQITFDERFIGLEQTRHTRQNFG